MRVDRMYKLADYLDTLEHAHEVINSLPENACETSIVPTDPKIYFSLGLWLDTIRCGTAACIAGATCLLFDPNKGWPGDSVRGTAQILLELKDRDVENLFNPNLMSASSRLIPSRHLAWYWSMSSSSGTRSSNR